MTSATENKETNSENNSTFSRINWIALPPWILSSLILFGSILLTIYVAGVYAEIGTWISGSNDYINFGDLGSKYVKSWPLIGGVLSYILLIISTLVNLIDLTIMGIIGILIFFVIQTLEILPTLVKGTPFLAKRLIKSMRNHIKIKKLDSDDQETKKMIDEYNDYKSSLIRNLKSLRFKAYVADLIIMITLMPIIRTSSGDEIRLLEAVNIIDLNGSDFMEKSLFRLACSMFLIHAIVVASVNIRRGVELLK